MTRRARLERLERRLARLTERNRPVEVGVVLTAGVELHRLVQVQRQWPIAFGAAWDRLPSETEEQFIGRALSEAGPDAGWLSQVNREDEQPANPQGAALGA